MAIYPAWPLRIGHEPLRDSISYGLLSDDEVFQPEDGEGFEITGPKTGATIYRYAGTWPIDRPHYPLWKRWWFDTVDRGRLPFWLIDPFEMKRRLWTRKAGSDFELQMIAPQIIHVKLELRSLPDA